MEEKVWWGNARGLQILFGNYSDYSEIWGYLIDFSSVVDFRSVVRMVKNKPMDLVVAIFLHQTSWPTKDKKKKKEKNTKNAWEQLMWFINSEQYSLDGKKRGKFWEWQRPFTKPRGEYVTAVMIEKCRSCWLPLYSLVISTEIGDTHSN